MVMGVPNQGLFLFLFLIIFFQFCYLKFLQFEYIYFKIVDRMNFFALNVHVCFLNLLLKRILMEI
jgi:hypothetical protein